MPMTFVAYECLAAAVAQVTLYYDTMDAASFDQIKLKQPSLSRPFSQQLGDNRSGPFALRPPLGYPSPWRMPALAPAPQ